MIPLFGLPKEKHFKSEDYEEDMMMNLVEMMMKIYILMKIL
jgi:hypothetical protein